MLTLTSVTWPFAGFSTMHNAIWHMSPLDQCSAFLFLHWKWDEQTSVSLGCEMDAGKDLRDLSSGTTQLAHTWAKELCTVSEGASKQDWELRLTRGVPDQLHTTAEAQLASYPAGTETAELQRLQDGVGEPDSGSHSCMSPEKKGL